MGAPNKTARHTCMSLNKRIETLEEQVEKLLKAATPVAPTKRQENSIQKVEDFSGEEIPVPEKHGGIRLTDQDRLRSMDNAIRCLPPNYTVEGRHTKENIGAICGFVVTDNMMDEVYSKVKHQNGMVVPLTE